MEDLKLGPPPVGCLTDGEHALLMHWAKTFAAAKVAAEREWWFQLMHSWVVEAELVSGPETAGWLELAIKQLGHNV